jgi:hypothetical protein
MPQKLLALVIATAACGPHLHSKAVSTRTYAATAACGQNLVDTSFVAEGAKWGESISVVVCGPRAISGHIQIDQGSLVWNGSFGSGQDNARCLASPVAVAATAEAAKEPGANGGAADAASTSRAVGPGARPVTAFREIPYRGEACPSHMTTVMQLLPIERGTRIGVRVWSREPNDLEGAILQIRHNIHRPSVSDAEWEKHLAKQEAKRQARIARGEPEAVGEPLQRPHEPNGPPPAARAEIRPPRPSVNAEWVAGYFHWAGEDWVWIGGSWRVPTGDVTRGLTVRAPRLPPPLRAETPPLAVAPGLVWVAGYWQWDGHGFVWVPGCWQVAPRRSATWISARWRASAGGVVFVPGGWR